MWTRTAITDALGLDLPIWLGPFGGGLSSVALTAAICEAGGLGFFGANPLQRDAILATADAIRARTARPFGFNLWVPNPALDATPDAPARRDAAVAALRRLLPEGAAFDSEAAAGPPDFDAQLEAAIAARPRALSFVFGIPAAAAIRRCRNAGIAVVGTATTPDEAAAWERAAADMVVVTGFEAGGHRVSFLRPPEASMMGLIPLLSLATRRVRIPLIAAGGLADGRAIAAALTLGAAAVQIGTAFLACPESAAPAAHKRRLLDGPDRETVLTRVFSGRLARGFANRLTHLAERDPGIVAPYPVQLGLTGQVRRQALATGRDDLISMWAGQAGALTRPGSAREILDRLAAETAAALGERPAP